MRKKHSIEGSYSFEYTLFLNEGITTRPKLEYSLFSLSFWETASKRMSENTVYIWALDLPLDFGEGHLNWPLSKVRRNQLFLKYVNPKNKTPECQDTSQKACLGILICVILLHLDISSFVGQEYLLQAMSLGHGTAHRVMFTLVIRKNEQSLLSGLCMMGNSSTHWVKTSSLL